MPVTGMSIFGMRLRRLLSLSHQKVSLTLDLASDANVLPVNPRLASMVFFCRIVEVGFALDKAKRADQGSVV